MYFMTTLRICGNIVDDCRTIGMKSSYGECYYSMLENTLDIFEEGYYQYGVISFVDEGFYPNIREQQWFKFTRENKKVIIDTCERPAEIGEYQLYIIG